MKTTIMLLATVAGIGFGPAQATAGDTTTLACPPKLDNPSEIFRDCDNREIALVPPKVKIPHKAEKTEKAEDRSRADRGDGGQHGGHEGRQNDGNGGNGNGGGSGSGGGSGPNN